MGGSTLVGRAGLGGGTSAPKAPTELGLVDEQLERLGPADRDDRDPLQVALEQPVVAVDVTLGEVERALGPDPHQQRSGLVAQAAPIAAVENDVAGDGVGASARSPVAYTSRLRQSGNGSGSANRAALP